MTADGHCVFFRRILDIHRAVVDQPVLKQSAQHLRIRTICV